MDATKTKPYDIDKKLVYDAYKAVKNLDDVRDAVSFARLRHKVSILLGSAAAAVQIACYIVTWAPISIAIEARGTSLFDIAVEYQFAVAVATGVILFPSVAVQGFPAAGVIFSAAEHKRRQSLRILGLMNVIPLFCQPSVRPLWSWLCLGIVTGVLLDLLRRTERQARRAEHSPDPSSICRKEPLPERLNEAAVGYPSNPLTCPILQKVPQNPKVFISYSRSSPWGTQLAMQLFENVASAGTETFVDVLRINTGSSCEPGSTGVWLTPTYSFPCWIQSL